MGSHVVVIGGGDTAIDAARVTLRLGHDAAGMARREGAAVTILYRRTRDEMPAIEREIEEALEENIRIEYLAAPAKIIRDDERQGRQDGHPAHGTGRARFDSRPPPPGAHRGQDHRDQLRHGDHRGEPVPGHRQPGRVQRDRLDGSRRVGQDQHRQGLVRRR